MTQQLLKHSVLVVTYNQEQYIGQCLDSILNQSVLPYELIVLDDCSTDRTWEVVEQYAFRYTRIIKPYRNDHNLGVFRNVNKIKNLATGDFVNFVSGDDMLPTGILEAYNQFIEQHALDCSAPFVIYSDSLLLYSDGSIQRKSNHRIKCHSDNILEYIALGCLWGWDTGMSRALLQAMEPLRTDMGYQADLLWHLDKANKAKAHYYLPADGYMYRVSVGVTNATKLTDHFASKRQVAEEILRLYADRITPKVRRYFRFDQAALQYRIEPNVGNYCRMVGTGLRALPFRYNSPFYRNWRIWIPVGLKKYVKRLLGREKR